MQRGIGSDGCCGEKELIKLATYTLEDHDIAVHLDLDTLVVNPLDEMFDVMQEARDQLGAATVAPAYVNRRATGNPSTPVNLTARKALANVTVDAYFTKDYNMIPPDGNERKEREGGGRRRSRRK